MSLPCIPKEMSKNLIVECYCSPDFGGKHCKSNIRRNRIKKAIEGKKLLSFKIKKIPNDSKGGIIQFTHIDGNDDIKFVNTWCTSNEIDETSEKDWNSFGPKLTNDIKLDMIYEYICWELSKNPKITIKFIDNFLKSNKSERVEELKLIVEEKILSTI